jgi:23S rRNA (uracil1939-C5)-methyltransferase
VRQAPRRNRPRGEGGAFRRVRIDKLAPTGEGIARTSDGVGFVDRALPGELVETTVYEMRKRFWRGSLRAVLESSPDRLEGPHADCAGCDWGHFAPEAAREAKRALFLETMVRLGKLEPSLFGGLPVVPSAAGYRIRTRLHAASKDGNVSLGYFAPGSHRIEPADECEAIAPATRALLPHVRAAIAESGADVSELALLEDLEGSKRIARATASAWAPEAAGLAARLAEIFQGVLVLGPDGARLVERGDRALALTVGARPFSVSVDTFFQANRHLLPGLVAEIRAEASRGNPGLALDAFGGAGLFGGALLDAGHRVISVESDPGAVADARRTRRGWTDGDRWEVVEAAVADFLEEEDRVFDRVVADPPRTGLGVALSGALAERTAQGMVYVSCDPATLARDLPVLLSRGLTIRTAGLYDLFAFTHRVEAVVVLERAA